MEKKDKVGSNFGRLERREYSVENRSDLRNIAGYLERFYVGKGDGLVSLRGDDFDIYHIAIDLGGPLHLPREGALVSLLYPVNTVVISASPRATGFIQTQLGCVINGNMTAERIEKSRHVLERQ